MENLIELIEEIVASKTFSLEAVEHIKKLRDGAVQANAELARLNKSVDLYKTSGEEKSARVIELTEECRILRSQLLDHEKLQKEAEKAIIVSHYEEKRREDIFQLVSLIFKSPTIKKVISESTITPMLRNSGGSTYAAGESGSRHSTEETSES